MARAWVWTVWLVCALIFLFFGHQGRVGMGIGGREGRGGRTSTRCSGWSHVPMAPRDPVLGVTEAYNKDPRPEKINLGVGAYRDAAGKPWVLPSVRMAEKLIFRRNITHEYAPLRGTNGLVERSIQIVYGHESPQIKHNCIAAIQSLSGTGALRLCGEFLSRFSKSQEVYVSNPTWENHISIFRDAGLEVQRYRYYDNKTRSLDFEGMVEDLSKAPQGSIIVIQALGHNPTGIDPTWSQWKQICQCCKNKKHLIIFDLAYQVKSRNPNPNPNPNLNSNPNLNPNSNPNPNPNQP
ncbi:hypothetical protein AAMO2058_001727600 [Amorphochlora amoebiformis]